MTPVSTENELLHCLVEATKKLQFTELSKIIQVNQVDMQNKPFHISSEIYGPAWVFEDVLAPGYDMSQHLFSFTFDVLRNPTHWSDEKVLSKLRDFIQNFLNIYKRKKTPHACGDERYFIWRKIFIIKQVNRSKRNTAARQVLEEIERVLENDKIMDSKQRIFYNFLLAAEFGDLEGMKNHLKTLSEHPFKFNYDLNKSILMEGEALQHLKFTWGLPVLWLALKNADVDKIEFLQEEYGVTLDASSCGEQMLFCFYNKHLVSEGRKSVENVLRTSQPRLLRKARLFAAAQLRRNDVCREILEAADPETIIFLGHSTLRLGANDGTRDDSPFRCCDLETDQPRTRISLYSVALETENADLVTMLDDFGLPLFETDTAVPAAAAAYYLFRRAKSDKSVACATCLEAVQKSANLKGVFGQLVLLCAIHRNHEDFEPLWLKDIIDVNDVLAHTTIMNTFHHCKKIEAMDEWHRRAIFEHPVLVDERRHLLLVTLRDEMVDKMVEEHCRSPKAVSELAKGHASSIKEKIKNRLRSMKIKATPRWENIFLREPLFLGYMVSPSRVTADDIWQVIQRVVREDSEFIARNANSALFAVAYTGTLVSKLLEGDIDLKGKVDTFILHFALENAKSVRQKKEKLEWFESVVLPLVEVYEDDCLLHMEGLLLARIFAGKGYPKEGFHALRRALLTKLLRWCSCHDDYWMPSLARWLAEDNDEKVHVGKSVLRFFIHSDLNLLQSRNKVDMNLLLYFLDTKVSAELVNFLLQASVFDVNSVVKKVDNRAVRFSIQHIAGASRLGKARNTVIRKGQSVPVKRIRKVNPDGTREDIGGQYEGQRKYISTKAAEVQENGQTQRKRFMATGRPSGAETDVPSNGVELEHLDTVSVESADSEHFNAVGDALEFSSDTVTKVYETDFTDVSNLLTRNYREETSALLLAISSRDEEKVKLLLEQPDIDVQHKVNPLIEIIKAFDEDEAFKLASAILEKADAGYLGKELWLNNAKGKRTKHTVRRLALQHAKGREYSGIEDLVKQKRLGTFHDGQFCIDGFTFKKKRIESKQGEQRWACCAEGCPVDNIRTRVNEGEEVSLVGEHDVDGHQHKINIKVDDQIIQVDGFHFRKHEDSRPEKGTFKWKCVHNRCWVTLKTEGWEQPRLCGRHRVGNHKDLEFLHLDGEKASFASFTYSREEIEDYAANITWKCVVSRCGAKLVSDSVGRVDQEYVNVNHNHVASYLLYEPQGGATSW